jgi:hypothetical protein
LSRKAQIFFPEFNIRLYDKNSESDYFFFLPPKPEFFFRKKTITPPPLFKLNSRSLNGKNVSKFIDEDLSSIQKIITESLKDNRSLDVKAVNEMMKIQLETLLGNDHLT